MSPPASWSSGTSLISAKGAVSGTQTQAGAQSCFQSSLKPSSASCAQVPGVPHPNPQKSGVTAGWVLGIHLSQWPWLVPSAKASLGSTTQTSGT